MKIVSTPNATWTHRATCSECTTVVDIELSDLKWEGGYDPRDPRERPYLVWRCPTCHHSTPVSESLVPQHLRYKLK